MNAEQLLQIRDQLQKIMSDINRTTELKEKIDYNRSPIDRELSLVRDDDVKKMESEIKGQFHTFYGQIEQGFKYHGECLDKIDARIIANNAAMETRLENIEKIMGQILQHLSSQQ